jgi:hypothetical protein
MNIKPVSHTGGSFKFKSGRRVTVDILSALRTGTIKRRKKHDFGNGYLIDFGYVNREFKEIWCAESELSAAPGD